MRLNVVREHLTVLAIFKWINVRVFFLQIHLFLLRKWWKVVKKDSFTNKFDIFVLIMPITRDWSQSCAFWRTIEWRFTRKSIKTKWLDEHEVQRQLQTAQFIERIILQPDTMYEVRFEFIVIIRNIVELEWYGRYVTVSKSFQFDIKNQHRFGSRCIHDFKWSWSLIHINGSFVHIVGSFIYIKWIIIKGTFFLHKWCALE